MELTKKPALMQENSKEMFHIPREQVKVFTRPHWLIPTQTIIITVLLSFVFLSVSFTGLIYIFSSPFLFAVTTLLIIMITLALIVKILADWYFHFYLITNRKISEVCYLPLSTHYVNEVLLDRVKCTEVDVRTDGIIKQLLNIGSVTVTFDRPTHQEAFVFWNVGNAKEIGYLLSGKPMEAGSEERTIYYRPLDNDKRYYAADEIMPGLSI